MPENHDIKDIALADEGLARIPVSYTHLSDDDFERFWKAGAVTGRAGSPERLLAVPAPVVRNEAFICLLYTSRCV